MPASKANIVADEEKKKYLRERFERRLSRFEARPLEISLVPAEVEPASRNAVSTNQVFAIWQNIPKRFVWFANEIGKSADVIAATIHAIMFDEPFDNLQPIYSGTDIVAYIYKAHFKKTGEEGYLPISTKLGCFFLKEPPAPMETALFFLYVGEAKLEDTIQGKSDLPARRPIGLYQFFQKVYAGVAGADVYDEKGDGYARLFGYHYQDQAYKPKRFANLANRSINRRRKVDLRTRARTLDRDKQTCQICGRRAPEVKLVVDHRIPVVQSGDNTDANLWTLCEECNSGKSNLPLFRF